MEVDVALDAPQQRGVVVLESIGRYDHHAIKTVQLLHQRVAVLIDDGGAGLAGGHALGEPTFWGALALRVLWFLLGCVIAAICGARLDHQAC